jgi:hypothetical protein
MKNYLRGALLAFVWGGLSVQALAQQPANQGVKSTATVEVLDDSAHVDDVISQLKRQPETKLTDSPAAARVKASDVSLKGERPDLSHEVLSQEKRNQAINKDDKRGGSYWQRAVEERAEHVRKARNR